MLVGHSFGGSTALAAGARLGEGAVGAVMLMDPFISGATAEPQLPLLTLTLSLTVRHTRGHVVLSGSSKPSPSYTHLHARLRRVGVGCRCSTDPRAHDAHSDASLEHRALRRGPRCGGGAGRAPHARFKLRWRAAHRIPITEAFSWSLANVDIADASRCFEMLRDASRCFETVPQR